MKTLSENEYDRAFTAIKMVIESNGFDLAEFRWLHYRITTDLFSQKLSDIASDQLDEEGQREAYYRAALCSIPKAHAALVESHEINERIALLIQKRKEAQRDLSPRRAMSSFYNRQSDQQIQNFTAEIKQLKSRREAAREQIFKKHEK